MLYTYNIYITAFFVSISFCTIIYYISNFSVSLGCTICCITCTNIIFLSIITYVKPYNLHENSLSSFFLQL